MEVANVPPHRHYTIRHAQGHDGYGDKDALIVFFGDDVLKIFVSSANDSSFTKPSLGNVAYLPGAKLVAAQNFRPSNFCVLCATLRIKFKKMA